MHDDFLRGIRAVTRSGITRYILSPGQVDEFIDEVSRSCNPKRIRLKDIEHTGFGRRRYHELAYSLDTPTNGKYERLSLSNLPGDMPERTDITVETGKITGVGGKEGTCDPRKLSRRSMAFRLAEALTTTRSGLRASTFSTEI